MIILFDTNCNIKKKVIEKWLKKNDINDDVTFINSKVNDTLIPIQPINSGCRLTCNDKISSIKNNLNEICDYIVLIDENLEIYSDKIVFYYYISILNMNTDDKVEKKSEVIEIRYDILDKFPFFLDVLDYLEEIYIESKNNYIYDGCSVTFSNIISKINSKLTEDNWTEEVFRKPKNELISNLLNSLNLESLNFVS